MGGSYYPIPCSILSIGKDRKTPAMISNVPTTSWRIFIPSMDSFQGLTPKSPSSWHRPLASKDLALYDNESWNDPRDFAKLVKAIALPQDVLMNKITTSCEICSGPYDTQYYMEDPEQAFVEYASLHTHEAGEGGRRERQPGNRPDSPTPPDPSISFITEKVLKFNSLFESLRLVPPSAKAELVCTKEEDGDVMFIEIIPKYDNSYKEEPEPGIKEVEYFDIFLTRSKLAYHKDLMCGPLPSIFLRNPIVIEGNPSNLKIPCNIGIKFNPKEDANGGVSNFTRRIKGMQVFIGNFTYIIDFMIIEDISSIIDP
ncbi:hypothetical protein Tco_0760100, partial [Tanacetum coccineum]